MLYLYVTILKLAQFIYLVSMPGIKTTRTVTAFVVSREFDYIQFKMAAQETLLQITTKNMFRSSPKYKEKRNMIPPHHCTSDFRSRTQDRIINPVYTGYQNNSIIRNRFIPLSIPWTKSLILV